MSNLRISPIKKKKKESSIRIQPTEVIKPKTTISTSVTTKPGFNGFSTGLSKIDPLSQNNMQITSDIQSGILPSKNTTGNIAPTKPQMAYGKSQIREATTISDGNITYKDTGKTYGDYNYRDYKNKKDWKIYKASDGNYYYQNPKDNSFTPVITNVATMSSASDIEKELEEAKKLGYKEWDRKNGTLTLKDRLDLDTDSWFNEEEKAKYEKQLSENKKKKSKEAIEELNEINYGGAGIKGALGELKTIGSNIIDSIDDNVIYPISKAGTNYKIGDLQTKQSLEYYKKMKGESNNTSQIDDQLEKTIKYNPYIVENPGAVGESIQQIPNQIEGLKESVEQGGALGVVGAVIGTGAGALVGKNPGTALDWGIKGAQAGAKVGYVTGQTENTYKLESGSAYKAMLDMGVPEEIAKKEAKRVGTENALIETGESIIDLATFGGLSGLQKSLANNLAKEYGESTVKTWLKNYTANIVTEGLEEGAQEWRSIEGEKRATEKAGIERDDSQDLNRIIESSKSGATTSAITGGVTSLTKVVGNKTLNAVGNKAKSVGETKIAKNNEFNQKLIEKETNELVQQIQVEENRTLSQEEVSIVRENVEANINKLKSTLTRKEIAEINNQTILKNSQNETTSNVEKKQMAPIDFDLQVENALNDNQSKGNIYISKQTDSKIINIIKKLTGIDVTNRKHVLSKDYIRHLFKHSNETNPGQISITKEDIKKIPDIVSNPDTIVRGSDTLDASRKNKIPSIRYIKTDNTGKMYVVEAIPEKGNLQIKTMWKEPTKLIHSNNALHHTSETANSSNSSTLTDNNDSIKTQKSQIAPLSSQYSMQQKTKNDTKATTNEMNESIKDDVIKVKPSQESVKLAKSINETIKQDVLVEKGKVTKQRRWIDTSLQSDAVEGKVLLEDLDTEKTTYVVQSNKKTLDKANSKLNEMGYEESVEYIKNQINSSNVSLTDVALAQRLIQEAIQRGDTATASDLIMDTAILGTDLGQKVQALSLIQRLTPEGQLRMFQKIVKRAKIMGDKSYENVEITSEMVELILGAYNSDGKYDQTDLNRRVEEFKQKVADQMKSTTSEKIVAWRYLSMLGNPKTHIRNIVSNIAMSGTVKVKNALARTIETALPINSRTKTWKKASDIVTQFAKKTTVEMKDIISGESKYSEKASLESKKKTFNNKLLEGVSNFNSDALSAEDWFFSKRAFESTLREYLTAQNIRTEEDIKNNPEIIEKAKQYAVEQAEIATFRQYSKVASAISKLERKNKAMGFVVGTTLPFKKTPINVAKTGVKYSPIGLIKSITYDAFRLKNNQIDASQFIDNLSQGITGTSLTLLGYALAKSGILKGAGDEDKEGKFDSYLGKQSYSLNFGGQSYSISWLSPVAMPLLVGANSYEQLEDKEEWDMNVVVDTLAQTLDPLSEMSFVSGLTDILSSYETDSVKMLSSIGTGMAQNYASQFFPTLFSQIASVFDDTKRTTKASNNSKFKEGEETIRMLMYKVPGLRSLLEPSTDIWGNEIKQSESIVQRAFENFLAPYSRKEDITTKLDKELKRVYQETGEKSVIPGVPSAYTQYDKVKYQMSAKEYTQYKKTYGETANEILSLLVKEDDYKDSPDTRKARMIKKAFEYATEISKTEFLENRNIEYDEDDFKSSYMSYSEMCYYIIENTRYMEDE